MRSLQPTSLKLSTYMIVIKIIKDNRGPLHFVQNLDDRNK
jgi:hypothetical protein